MCKLTKSEILAKAKDIVQKQEEEKEHIDICVKARICPECGEDLNSRIVTRYHIQVYCKSCNFYKMVP